MSNNKSSIWHYIWQYTKLLSPATKVYMTCQKCKGHFPKVSCLKIADGSEWELIGVDCLVY